MTCEIGDIVLISKFKYPDGTPGSLHFFVVMDIKQDEFTLVNIEYLCFLISSNTSKNNTINPNFPYNEPIFPADEIRLPEPSHVKCDILISIVNKDDIIMNIGKITQEQYDRFIELYEESLSQD